MKKLSKTGLGIIILVGALLGAKLLIQFKPEAAKEGREIVKPVVEVLVLKPVAYKVILPSQGIIEPITQTMASAEVAGRIIWVSDKFEAGERFTVGVTPETSDVLLRIDPTDYEAALAQAQANEAEAELTLATELARQSQSKRDWDKLKSTGAPTALVLREPQVKSARSHLAAAKSAVAKAQADLARTELRAPYNGRIRSTATDLGSFAAPGSPLAELYRTDILEIRLPLSLDDYAFIDSFEGGERTLRVDLKVEIAGRSYDWSAEIVRTEGQVDRASRSVYVVARIKTAELSEKFDNTEIDLLAPGLFVKAQIHGRTFDSVFLVPRKAFYTPDNVVLIDESNRLRLRKVNILRNDGKYVLVQVGAGLEPGERVCQTALDTIIEGMEVEIQEAEAEPSRLTKTEFDNLGSEQP